MTIATVKTNVIIINNDGDLSPYTWIYNIVRLVGISKEQHFVPSFETYERRSFSIFERLNKSYVTR